MISWERAMVENKSTAKGDKSDFRDSLFVRRCRGRGGVQAGDAGREQSL